jgi:hypothetical protein
MSLHRRNNNSDTARILSFAAMEIVCSKHTIPLYRPPRHKTEMVEHKISPGIGLSDNQVMGNKISGALQPRIMCVQRWGYKPSNTYFPNANNNSWFHSWFHSWFRSWFRYPIQFHIQDPDYPNKLIPSTTTLVPISASMQSLFPHTPHYSGTILGIRQK